MNGYQIRYNILWNTWQVSHDEIGACIAEFDNEASAKEYCTAGQPRGARYEEQPRAKRADKE